MAEKIIRQDYFGLPFSQLLLQRYLYPRLLEWKVAVFACSS